MSTPVLVVERDSGEVYLFRSETDASRYLEPIDVERQEYEAFDSEGRPLELVIRTDDSRQGVRLATRTEAPCRSEEARSKLRIYFGRLGRWKDDYDRMPFGDLLVMLTERFARI